MSKRLPTEGTCAQCRRKSRYGLRRLQLCEACAFARRGHASPQSPKLGCRGPIAIPCHGCEVLTLEHDPERLCAKQRDRARRILIFRNMLDTTDSIHFGQVEKWPYQPTREEVNAELTEEFLSHEAKVLGNASPAIPEGASW